MREIAEVGAGVSGQVRIGVLPTLARFLMPPLCRVFLQDAPGVTLRTVIAQNDVLGRHLEAGEVDFILTTAVRATEDLVNHAVLEDEAVVIASRKPPDPSEEGAAPGPAFLPVGARPALRGHPPVDRDGSSRAGDCPGPSSRSRPTSS